MRTWYGYDSEGMILSVETVHGGWSEGAHPGQNKARTARRAAQGVVGWMSYDCACPSSRGTCACRNEIVAGSYVRDGAWQSKFPIRLIVNGAVRVHRGRYSLPGPLKVRVESAAPASTLVLYVQRGVNTERLPLQFSDGASETIEIPLAREELITLGPYGAPFRHCVIVVAGA